MNKARAINRSVGGDKSTGSSLGGGLASAPALQQQSQSNIWGNAISSIGQAGISGGASPSQYSPVSVPSQPALNFAGASAPPGLIPVTQQQPDLMEVLQRILGSLGTTGGYG